MFIYVSSALISHSISIFSVGPNTLTDAIARQQQQVSQSNNEAQQHMNQPNGQGNLLSGEMSTTNRYPSALSDYPSSGVRSL